jgi:hypothetical protein
MINRVVALCLVMLGATVFVSSAHAQRHGGFAPAPVGRTGTGGSGRRGMRTNFVHTRRSRGLVGGWDFAPYYYSDYDYEPGTSEAPPPEGIERAGQPAAPAPVPAAGLVLELQGDHWVRITNYGESQTAEQSRQLESERALTSKPTSVPPANPRRAQVAEPPSQLPPAVLLFRDGHKEEVGKYLIVGATIYTNSDYWTSGSWTRKVQIADLDVPATLKLNQERGAKFSLPSAPNEVMIRQ